MNGYESVLTSEEKISLTLRALYASYGYGQYRMSKFEEYDLYAKNKDFLVSESVITFTDTDGRLMALKPDVTLSIIKNAKEQDGLWKVFYNEHVYRVSKSAKCFKEITQVGLECLGEVNDEVVAETVVLAEKSLTSISKSCALELSDLDLVSVIMNGAGLSEAGREELFVAVGEKNLQGVLSVCEREGLSSQNTAAIAALVTAYGEPERVLETLLRLTENEKAQAAIGRLQALIEKIRLQGSGENLRIDFSLLGDRKYYNGIVFQGFIEGVPQGVLSGGQYDQLVKKMGKTSRGVGFAVYLDGLDLGEEDV